MKKHAQGDAVLVRDSEEFELPGVRVIQIFLCIFFSGKNKQVSWLGRENKTKPWQPRNVQKYNKNRTTNKINLMRL